VGELRGSPVANAPAADLALHASGGLSFQDPDPRSGQAVKAASVDPTQVYFALRYRAPRR
jgi:hypothetical protein